ncbi:MAG: hypothetical protein ASARMPREDX12_008394 [Alectoria sarmentosa]|nr:MAG: hypothetical protein ASARMPREDX12_008394 [Alectoria sarmentosa]
MTRIRIPLPAYLSPHRRGRYPRQNGSMDIELGLISTASFAEDDTSTPDGQNESMDVELGLINSSSSSFAEEHTMTRDGQSNGMTIALGFINTANNAEEGTPTAEDKSTTHLNLQTYPLELRLRIYGFVLIRPHQIVWHGQYMTKKPHSQGGKIQQYVCNKPQDPDHATALKNDSNIAAILLTCRAIYQEAAAPFYRHNDFVIKCQTPPSTAIFLFSFNKNIHQSHHLASGLPHAFESQLFRANAQYVTFACANAEFTRVGDHVCAPGTASSDRIGEIASRCPALKTLAVREPDVEGMPVAEPGLWPSTRAGHWAFVLGIVGWVAAVVGLVLVVRFWTKLKVSPPTRT